MESRFFVTNFSQMENCFLAILYILSQFFARQKTGFHPILYCATCKIKRGRPTLHDYTFSFRVEVSLIIAYLAAMVKNRVEDSSI